MRVLAPCRERHFFMWEFTIGGIDLYHILNWLFIYSFLGWVWESCYVSVKEKRLVNRGFVTGPVCTIYGFGAVSVYLILKPVSGNLFWLYLGGVIVPTILEYATAVLMERIFHTSWWDYSRNRFNFQGRICLGASLGWGIFSIILFYGFQPAVDRIVDLYSVSVGKLLVGTASFIYAADFGMSFMNAMRIGEKLHHMDAVIDELSEYIQSTRLFRTTEELRERLEGYPGFERGTELRRRLEARIDAIAAFGGAEIKELHGEHKAQIEERISLLRSRYEEIRNRGSRFANRFADRAMNAYPHMKSRAQALRDRRKK